MPVPNIQDTDNEGGNEADNRTSNPNNNSDQNALNNHNTPPDAQQQYVRENSPLPLIITRNNVYAGRRLAAPGGIRIRQRRRRRNHPFANRRGRTGNAGSANNVNEPISLDIPTFEEMPSISETVTERLMETVDSHFGEGVYTTNNNILQTTINEAYDYFTIIDSHLGGIRQLVHEMHTLINIAAEINRLEERDEDNNTPNTDFSTNQQRDDDRNAEE